MKSEPETFSIDDLKKCPQKRDSWDGVRNYQARNYMKEMKKGDFAFFYHSNCKPPGIIGIVKIVREAYPDHTAFDSKSKYYDSKSTLEKPRWFMVDVAYEKKLKRYLSLDELKENKKLHAMPLLRKGNRLSITPLTKKEWDEILKIASN